MTVVYQGKYSHCMRIGVAVPLNSTVSRLRDAVSRETKIPQDQVLHPSYSLIPSSLGSVLLGYIHTEVNLNALCSGGTELLRISEECYLKRTLKEYPTFSFNDSSQGTRLIVPAGVPISVLIAALQCCRKYY